MFTSLAAAGVDTVAQKLMGQKRQYIDGVNNQTYWTAKSGHSARDHIFWYYESRLMATCMDPWSFNFATKETDYANVFRVRRLSCSISAWIPSKAMTQRTRAQGGLRAAAGNRRPGGSIIADVRADIVADLVTGTWVLPAEVAGGSLALGLIVPLGRPRVNAELVAHPTVVSPIGRRASDSAFDTGNPVASMALGWHSGNWH
ncbi:transporter [Xanthobacter sp. NFM-89]|uniref:transporter n=2 Tax=unclassified Xanthobacter TaxID=2623496 RepID=UPI00351D14E6